MHINAQLCEFGERKITAFATVISHIRAGYRANNHNSAASLFHFDFLPIILWLCEKRKHMKVMRSIDMKEEAGAEMLRRFRFWIADRKRIANDLS